MKKNTPKKSAKKTTKKKNGRPSKIDKLDKELTKLLYKAGLIDQQVADVLKVHLDTIQNWKKKDPKFFESIKDWKLQADGKVVRSLYQSAIGFTSKNKKAVVVSDGKDVGSHVEMVEEEIQHAPNSTSMIFWLKNRLPKEWRDKINVEHGIDDDPEFRNAFFGIKKDNS